MHDEPAIVRAIAVVVLCVTAAAIDIRTRRVPNALTFGAAGLALVAAAATGGLQGAGISVLGWLAGAALFFPFFALGGMGAGDVKLLAAVGAWLGPAGALWTALYGAVAGGVLAVAVALRHRYLASAVANVAGMLRWWSVAGMTPVPRMTLAETRGPRLAYALPILIGAVVTLWLR